MGNCSQHKKAIDAWEYVDNNDIEGWKAEWDTIELFKKRMYQQIKDPYNFHFGIKKEGYKLYVIDYYTRKCDSVVMIGTGDEIIPYRNVQSYLNEWKEHALKIDEIWSEQYRIINMENQQTTTP
ncbi:MAG: hypothetical protein K6A94_06925 [Bacteroidales bacterium]|nr:hypothetical protein [Bacteroidales bacterium]